MTNTHNNPIWLIETAKTIQHYESRIERESGRKFNIFEILRIGRREVTTHSPVIAELLDPHGTHGQGSRFLQLFIECLELQDVNADDFVRVSQEKHFTSKSGQGRIDILIQHCGGKHILIENKIDADEQEMQLTRYHEAYPQAQWHSVKPVLHSSVGCQPA